MYIKWGISFLICALAVNGFKFGINDGYKHLVEKMQSMAVLSDAPIKVRWIEQKLDHFDSNEKRTWKMKYFERIDFWKINGPIYLFMGGEYKAGSGLLASGIVYELAKETKGAIFGSEHRYYGDSQPLNRSSVENMKYLNALQALADAAHLLRTIKKKILYRKSKVVVVGGSYAGNLAAWMRLLYPELVDAAIASSGPVLAKRDFQEYLEVVNKNYEHYGGPNCIEKIEKIFNRYDSLFQSEEGIKQLKKEERICEDVDMTRPENKQVFFLSKTAIFMVNSQYGTTDQIEKHCTRLDQKGYMFSEEDDEECAWDQKQKCNNYDYNSFLDEYREEENDWILCWTYQTCTEFGYFQSSNSDNQPFTKNVPVEFYDKICEALFGVGFDRDRVDAGVQKVNELFGGRTPNVTNVVFSNGELDPWSALSVLEDISYDAPAVLIPRSSHCRDLFSDIGSDPEELKEARKHIKYLIKNWIGAGDYVK